MDVGANFVRGAHYAQDQRFLDRCDELGIVVWEETLGPGTTTADLTNAYFMKYQVLPHTHTHAGTHHRPHASTVTHHKCNTHDTVW